MGGAAVLTRRRTRWVSRAVTHARACPQGDEPVDAVFYFVAQNSIFPNFEARAQPLRPLDLRKPHTATERTQTAPRGPIP